MSFFLSPLKSLHKSYALNMLMFVEGMRMEREYACISLYFMQYFAYAQSQWTPKSNLPKSFFSCAPAIYIVDTTTFIEQNISCYIKRMRVTQGSDRNNKSERQTDRKIERGRERQTDKQREKERQRDR